MAEAAIKGAPCLVGSSFTPQMPQYLGFNILQSQFSLTYNILVVFTAEFWFALAFIILSDSNIIQNKTNDLGIWKQNHRIRIQTNTLVEFTHLEMKRQRCQYATKSVLLTPFY